MAKQGRNELCACGSGKKYKKCCIGRDQIQVPHLSISREDLEFLVESGKGRRNLRFNRYETSNDHFYLNEFGFSDHGDQRFSGYIKVKLAHGAMGSIIVPDVVLVQRESDLGWIQPFNFFPCLLAKEDEEKIGCKLVIDIAFGKTIFIWFESKDYARSYNDGSELYLCTITGPENLMEFVTGSARLLDDNKIELTLFHHTSNESAALITEGGHFRTSQWNIQGTKKLNEVGYVYLTGLPNIVHDGDLRQIAMAGNATITLIRDGFVPPKSFVGSMSVNFPKDSLDLTVYRESTKNRTHSLEVRVMADHLAPQHLHFHMLNPPFYTVCCPFIHRAGTRAGGQLGFSNGHLTEKPESPIEIFRHIVVGNCALLGGLRAPFDEETTQHVFKIEFVERPLNALKFWFREGNTDLFTDKEITSLTFKRTP